MVEQYVAIRNSYLDLLLTGPVTVAETREWLRKARVKVLGLAAGQNLLGAAILYLDRANEIAFFVKEPGKGVGTRLLEIVVDEARRSGLDKVWAWALKRNLPAQKSFEKAGFSKAGETTRTCGGRPEQGIEYRRLLSEKAAG